MRIIYVLALSCVRAGRVVVDKVAEWIASSCDSQEGLCGLLHAIASALDALLDLRRRPAEPVPGQIILDDCCENNGVTSSYAGYGLALTVLHTLAETGPDVATAIVTRFDGALKAIVHASTHGWHEDLSICDISVKCITALARYSSSRLWLVVNAKGMLDATLALLVHSSIHVAGQCQIMNIAKPFFKMAQKSGPESRIKKSKPPFYLFSRLCSALAVGAHHTGLASISHSIASHGFIIAKMAPTIVI